MAAPKEPTDCLGEEEDEDFLEQVTAELSFESVSSVYSGGREVHLRQRKYETSWHVQGSPNSPSVHWCSDISACPSLSVNIF